MSTKDLIAQLSTIGEVFKMMPGVDVSDDTLRTAILSRKPGELIGETLLGMGVITMAQLTQALELQRKMRTARSVEDVSSFFDEVRAHASHIASTLDFAIPRTVA